LRLLLYLYARFLISPRTHTLLPEYNFLAILFPKISLHSLIPSWTKRLFRFFSRTMDRKFAYFCWLPFLWLEAKSAASILKKHTHGNRALDHESLDEEVMVYWNATLLHLSDQFIKSSSNTYFFQLNDKHWIFFRKTEQYRLF
jgi:hypothetical protein